MTGAEEHDGRIVVTGTGGYADEVTGLLARRGMVVTGLRIKEHTLDDAYVALTSHQN